jgi:hypothetical protein
MFLPGFELSKSQIQILIFTARPNLLGHTIGLHFGPEDGGNRFLRNVDNNLPDYTVENINLHIICLLRINTCDLIRHT